jgi:acetyltransferase-like isoleucine patch superfamily enzyme
VEGQSEVSLSTIGERAVVSFNTRIVASVLYPMSMGSYPCMQMCLLGQRAMHMGGAYPIDMKLSRGELLDVKVKHQGRVVESGKKFLGICIGHRAIVGTGLWIQSGVEVPNDYILVRDKDAIVTKIPAGMEGQTLSLQPDGQLRPYGQAPPPPPIPISPPELAAEGRAS